MAACASLMVLSELLTFCNIAQFMPGYVCVSQEMTQSNSVKNDPE